MTKLDEALMKKRELEKKKAEMMRRRLEMDVEREIGRILRKIKES